MGFVSLLSLTISALGLAALGGLLLHRSRGEAACLLRRSGAAILCLGAGFAMLLFAPRDVEAPVRVIGQAALMLSYGLLWGAVRRFDRRSAAFEAVSAGALVWLLAAALVDPSVAARIALTSSIVAAYSFAAAFEHRRGGDGGQARRRASWIFAAQGAVFALRALLSPASWSSGDWSALLGPETLAFAVLLAGVSADLVGERRATGHRARDPDDGLEDALTGVGNRRALQRSGTALLAACRTAGQPACLLLMDLDGLQRVNDRHGDAAGDRLLTAFARLAHDYLPPTSLVCRTGGGELAALVPGADLLRARAVADEIRALFAHLVLDGPGGQLCTTVSIGVAEDRGGQGPGDRVDLAALMDRADLCRRSAKEGGRDRVVAEGDPDMAVPAPRRRSAA